jgi:hypothetical protein
VALTLAGNPALSKLSMHALMATIAMPLVMGLAAIAFGAMAAAWPNVFERGNDRFAASIYVLIGVAIAVACASTSLRIDWPGYLIAGIAIPILPTLAARRLRRVRPTGFGAEAIETYREDRPKQVETRFAEPVIAPRARKPVGKPALAPKPAVRSRQSAPPPRTERPKDASRQPSKVLPLPPNNKTRRGQAAAPARARLAPGAGRLIEYLRRRIAAVARTQATPLAKPSAGNNASAKPAPARSAQSGRPTSTLPAKLEVSRATQPSATKTEPSATRAQALATAPARASAKPASARPALTKPALAKPLLLPPGVTPATQRARPQQRTVIETNDRRKPPTYPLTAPFEPGSERWATFVDGVLITETGIQHKIAARSTQAFDDLSGAA